MTISNRISALHFLQLAAAGLAVLAVGACGTLNTAAAPPSAFYTLEGARGTASSAVLAALPAAPTLIVNAPNAAAGFDSSRIIYVREIHKLEYFAHSEWVDPPARMLAPLLVAALQSSGAFRAVALTPSAATGELRLDTEIIRLQQEFIGKPSSVRFTLRAYLVEDKTRQVLAWREFDAVVASASEDPYGGVVAANRAVQTVLARLSAFCAEESRSVHLEK